MKTLGVTAVARRLGLSYTRIVRLANESRLPSIRDHAGRRVFNDADVEAFADARAARQATEPRSNAGVATPAA